MASFELSEAGFEIKRNQLVSDDADGKYTAGTIEYAKNGQVLAKVDFGDGTTKEKAKCKVGSDEFEIDLKGEYEGKKDDKEGKYEDDNCHKKKHGKKEKGEDKGGDIAFKKVLIEPLVKAATCDYIVSGIIKYYDAATGDWLATVDFGDGTCDDIATKTTPDGSSTFTVSDYF